MREPRGSRIPRGSVKGGETGVSLEGGVGDLELVVTGAMAELSTRSLPRLEFSLWLVLRRSTCRRRRLREEGAGAWLQGDRRALATDVGTSATSRISAPTGRLESRKI